MNSQLFWTLLIRGALIAGGLLASIITARFLGPEGRGVYFYWITLVGFALQFGNLGLHSSNTYLLGKGRAELSELADNVLWVSIVAGTFLAGLMIVVMWMLDDTFMEHWTLLCSSVLMIPAGLYFMLGTNLLVAANRISEYNFFELVNRYLGLLVIFFASWFWGSPQALLLCMSIVSVLMCRPLFHRLRISGGGRGSIQLLKEGFGYGFRAYLTAALGFAVLRLNALLLEPHIGADAFGKWSIAAQLLDVIAVFPGTVALILFPRIVRSAQPFNLMRSHLGKVGIFLALVCICAALVGDGAIALVYGDAFAGAYNIFLWGLPGVFALGLTSVASQYLASVGFPSALVWIWFVGLLVEYFSAIMLIPNFGGEGGMIALSIAYITIFLMIWILTVFHNAKEKAIVNV